MADPRRRERLASVIEQVVSQVVAQELRDPGIAEIVSITRVEVSADVSVARVHVSAMGDEAARTATMRAFERATGYVRRRLASELRIRQVPEVVWSLDRSIERGDRVIALLNSLVIPPEDAGEGAEAAPRARDDRPGRPVAVEVLDEADGLADGASDGPPRAPTRPRVRGVPRGLPMKKRPR